MLDYLESLLGTTPIVLALLLARAVNVPKAGRVRQYLLPVVAIVYLVAALVVVYPLNTWFDSLLGSIFRLAPLLQDWYSTVWLYVIENTAIVLVWVALKSALRPVFSRVAAGETFFGSAAVSQLYDFDPDYNTWFLQRRLGGARAFYRVLAWASLIVAVVLIALVDSFPAWPGFLAISFPALAAMVIAEISFSIDGLTRPEYEENIYGEEDSATRVAHYGGLREVYRQLFGRRAVDAAVTLSSLDPTSSYTRVEELERSPKESERIAGAFFGRLKRSGRDLDTNLIDASVHLLRHESVVINNPFYEDLTDYLALPVYYRLLQYGKCLIVAGRDSAAHDLSEWMRRGLESITGVPELWRVGVLTEHDARELDVGILRFADIHNLDLIAAADEFLRAVEIVILAEPSRMLTTGQVGLGLVLDRCGGDASPVYAAFDRNHDGLVDTLSHLLKSNLTTVVASALPYGAGSHVVWRGDGPPMHVEILPEVTRYLGVGTEIATVALKYQVSRVEWVGADAFPVEDMAWIAGQYYGQLGAFAGLDISQHALAESIVPVANPWQLARSDNRFLVVEDEIANAYESVRLYSTRADREGFVNLISSDYLLRDYMVANRQIFEADPKAVPSFVPDFARTERNAVFRLVLTLLSFEVPHDDLIRELELIGVSVPEAEPNERKNHRSARGGASDAAAPEPEHPVVSVVTELIERHTGVPHAPVISVMSYPEDGQLDGDSVPSVSYRIRPGSALDEIIAQLKPAYFFVEDELLDQNYIGAALFGHVYQMLLPGQFLTYAGKYYEVQSVGREALRNGVVLRRAADHINDRRTYRQLRRFAISDLRATGKVGARMVDGGVGVRRIPATVQVQSVGFVEQTSRAALGSGRRVELDGIPSREYREKEVLELSLPDVPGRVRRTIALLLNELFVTIFPHSVPFIVALTRDDEAEFGDLLDDLEIDGGEDSIYIVEDSVLDLGLVLSVERNWRRLFELIADFLEWQNEDQDGRLPSEATSLRADSEPSLQPGEPNGLGPVDWSNPQDPAAPDLGFAAESAAVPDSIAGEPRETAEAEDGPVEAADPPHAPHEALMRPDPEGEASDGEK
jgi:hypothetical protein